MGRTRLSDGLKAGRRTRIHISRRHTSRTPCVRKTVAPVTPRRYADYSKGGKPQRDTTRLRTRLRRRRFQRYRRSHNMPLHHRRHLRLQLATSQQNPRAAAMTALPRAAEATAHVRVAATAALQWEAAIAAPRPAQAMRRSGRCRWERRLRLSIGRSTPSWTKIS